jgi:hypothetical protein
MDIVYSVNDVPIRSLVSRLVRSRHGIQQRQGDAKYGCISDHSKQHSPKATSDCAWWSVAGEKVFAYTRFTIFAKECQAFEHTYHKGSDQFLQEFEAGAWGDDEQWFDWYAALRVKMAWEKKYQILGDISWNE